MADSEQFYLIGSWIPTIGELKFNDFSKEYMEVIESKKIINAKFIFDQLSYEKINRITIQNISSNTVYAEVKDITLEKDGYWVGKLWLKRKNNSPDDTWFTLLLEEVGFVIKEYYHEHLFHQNKYFSPIAVESVRITKSDYNNAKYTNTAFMNDVLINLLVQYNRKFDRYKEVLIEKVNHSDICSIDDIFNFTVQIKGELLFYKSFMELFSKYLGQLIEKYDDYSEMTTDFVDIFYNKANFINSVQVLKKSYKLAGISIVLGVVSLFTSIVGIIVSVIIAT